MNYTSGQIIPSDYDISFLIIFIPMLCWIALKLNKGYIPTAIKEAKEDVLPYEESYRVCPYKENLPSKTALCNIALEKTPKGFVYMRYNKEEEGFEYWADTNIDYKYLDTVARKYTYLFGCRGIYINRFEMLKRKITTLKQEILKNKEMALQQANKDKKDNDSDDSVFVKLKVQKNIKLKTDITRADIVCDKANKFIHCGKLKDSKADEIARP